MAYYIQQAGELFPIFGATSLDEARAQVPQESHARIVESADDVLMNPHTGSVDFRSCWAAEGFTEESADLVLVRFDAEDESWVEA
jgi:hypothetical protein